MKVLTALIVACLVGTTPVLAQSPETATPAESRPSEESVRRLLEITQAKKILQTVSDQMDGMFAGMLKKQLEGQDVTPEQQQEITARQKAAADMVKSLLDWKAMEPMYVKIYSDTFTQAEIDGIVAFYSSPAGQAVIAKLPLAAKNTMTEMQQRVQQMIPKLQQMAKDAADEVKAKGPVKKSG